MSADENAKFGPGQRKPSLAEIPPVALLAMGMVHKNGADKYGAFNWREGGVDIRTYYNAAMRHLMAMWDGQDYDPDSGISHCAHVMACMAIILDAEAQGVLEDNRPSVSGATARTIENLMKAMEGKGAGDVFG